MCRVFGLLYKSIELLHLPLPPLPWLTSCVHLCTNRSTCRMIRCIVHVYNFLQYVYIHVATNLWVLSSACHQPPPSQGFSVGQQESGTELCTDLQVTTKGKIFSITWFDLFPFSCSESKNHYIWHKRLCCRNVCDGDVALLKVLIGWLALHATRSV